MLLLLAMPQPWNRCFGTLVRKREVIELEIVANLRIVTRSTMNLKVTTPAGLTPLHSAAKRGHGDISQILLRNGADPKLQDNYKRTAAALAAFMNQRGALEALFEAGSPKTSPSNHPEDWPLLLAVKGGHLDLVKLLLPMLSRTNKNAALRVAIRVAKKKQQAEMLKYLERKQRQLQQ